MTATARGLLVAVLFSAPAAALGANGCGEQVILGGDPVPPCQDQPCGKPCTFDPCGGGMTGSTGGCHAPTSAGVCDGSGSCKDKLPECALRLPCLGMTCNEPCETLQPDASGSFLCDQKGECKPVPPPLMCDPCGELACGSACPCAMMMGGGGAGSGCALVCDAHGGCVPSSTSHCPKPPPPEPCGGMSQCGDPCQPCDPQSPQCHDPPPGPLGCDHEGMCVPSPACP